MNRADGSRAFAMRHEVPKRAILIAGDFKTFGITQVEGQSCIGLFQKQVGGHTGYLAVSAED